MMISRILENSFDGDRAEAEAPRSDYLWSTGALLLLFPLLNFVLTAAWFIAGGSISQPFALIALGLAFAGSAYITNRMHPGAFRITLVAALATFVVAIAGSTLVLDTSIDGQHYHFEAFYALAKGWNPFHGATPPAVIADPITPWAIHYPRAGWIFSANLLAAGFPLLTVKCLNFLVLFATAALSISALLRAGFSGLFATVLAAVVVLNPVVLSQLFTSMNDGTIALCMMVFVLAAATWIVKRDPRVLVPGLAAMILALNLKFSAIPIFVILCACTCIGVYFVRGQRAAAGVGAALFAAGVMAIAVLGWSPYVQNYLDFGHVFHPVMGDQAIDIMTGESPALDNTPEVLKPLSAGERFLYSLFSETHSGYGGLPHLKWPFTLSGPELRAAGGVDVRLAGFGPLFSGVLVLALACAAYLAVSQKLLSRTSVVLILIAGAFLLSVVIMPQNWWARYVPQFWYVPLCVAGAALTITKRPAQLAGAGIVAVMFLNAALAGTASAWLALQRSTEARDQIQQMADASQTYCVYPEMIQSRLYLMREAGIDARFSYPETISCAEPAQIAGYGPDRYGGVICACTPE